VRIPLTITARNEERALGACLDALALSARLAERELSRSHRDVTFDVLVVCDDCTDGTARVARSRGVQVAEASGGKVAAQRRGHRVADGTDFELFCDADVAVDERALLHLVSAMLADPALRVAVPRKRPVPPARRTPIAYALYVYNANNGFASPRVWFSGKLFAIRGWDVPFGLMADDVWLSRTIDPTRIREVPEALLWFRAPETVRGAYRYYRRLRRAFEECDARFPGTRAAHVRRRTDPERLALAPALDRAAFRLFEGMLATFRVAYAAERAYHRATKRPWDTWKPIAETKAPLTADPGRAGSAPKA
jgi:glycosyltransferase involved in cell wall biosynthesis